MSNLDNYKEEEDSFLEICENSIAVNLNYGQIHLSCGDSMHKTNKKYVVGEDCGEWREIKVKFKKDFEEFEVDHILWTCPSCSKKKS